MKNFLLLVALILSFTFDAAAARLRDDVTSNTTCKIVGYIQSLYQCSLLVIQIGYIAELLNCGVGKRSNKFTQSTLKQSNSIVYFIAQNVLFYIQPKPLNWIEFR